MKVKARVEAKVYNCIQLAPRRAKIFWPRYKFVCHLNHVRFVSLKLLAAQFLVCLVTLIAELVEEEQLVCVA